MGIAIQQGLVVHCRQCTMGREDLRAKRCTMGIRHNRHNIHRCSGILLPSDKQHITEKRFALWSKPLFCYNHIPTIFVFGSSALRFSVFSTNFAATWINACPSGLSAFIAIGIPASPLSQMLCTNGICPISGML